MKISIASENASPNTLRRKSDLLSVSYLCGNGRYAAKNITDSTINDVMKSR